MTERMVHVGALEQESEVSELTIVTKRFEQARGPTLVYDDLGEVSSPAVVLLHGGTGTRKSWLHVPERLAPGYRVLAMDMRGHGDSGRAGGAYRIEHYATDVVAFIEQVAEGSAALVGHSWGGLVAAQVAGTRPELVERAFFEDVPLQWETVPRSRGARAFRPDDFRARIEALLDDGASEADLQAAVMQEWAETGDFFQPRRELFLARKRRGASIEDLVEQMLQTPSPTGGTVGDLFGADQARELIGGLLTFDPEVFTTKDALASYDPKRPMTCPVFMLRADPALGPPPIGAGFPPEAVEPFLATHPQATVEFVEGASHGIHMQMPDLFVEKLEAFLGGRRRLSADPKEG